MKTRAGCLLLALVSLPARPLGAQPSATGQAIAETLFQEARRLMVAGQFAEACPKLEESQRLDPGDGTRITLAQCYERTGRLSAAWLIYTELAAGSSTPRPEPMVRTARERLARIDRALARVVLRVPASLSALDGVVVRLDGVALGAAVMGVPVPVDPGRHEVTASAPHHVSWTVSFEAVASQAITFDVPALAPEPPPPPPASVAPPTSAAPPVSVAAPVRPPPAVASTGSQRTGAYVVAGVGAASVVTGLLFGLKSLLDHRESDRLCPQSPCTDARGVERSEAAVRAGNVSTVLVGAGLAGVGVGAVLWLTAPTPSAGQARWLSPVLGAHGGGVQLGGSF